MYIKTILVLTACLLVNGFKCPDYCTCTKSFSEHIENTTIRAKCTKIDGINNFTKILSNINAIDLSGITLSDVSNKFNNFKVLFDLDLSHNELSKIPKLNNRITKLSLSHNQLTSSSIAKLPLHVQYLDLTHNKITFMPKDMMRLNRLRKLELAGNPIDCNCETIRARNWLAKHFIATDLPIMCTTPKQFENRSWLEIDQTDICGRRLFKRSVNNESVTEIEGLTPIYPILPTALPSSHPSNGSGSNESIAEIEYPLQPSLPPTNKQAALPKSTDRPSIAKDVQNSLPKKKSGDGNKEVYATSGTAGVIIILLTVIAAYKKHHKGSANIEEGEDGEELKTIGGLELAKATKLVMEIDKQINSKETNNLEEDNKPEEDVSDLQATPT